MTRCGNCWYFTIDGQCKRFPPTPIEVRYYNGSGNYNYAVESVYPQVSVSDKGCGEFKRKTEEHHD